MLMAVARSRRQVALCVSLLALLFARTALGCDPPATIRDGSPEEIRAFIKGKKMEVLTFLGYSGAEYENKAVMPRASHSDSRPI